MIKSSVVGNPFGQGESALFGAGRFLGGGRGRPGDGGGGVAFGGGLAGVFLRQEGRAE